MTASDSDDRDRTIERVQRGLMTIGRRGTARIRRQSEPLSVVDRSILSFIDENPGARGVDIAAHFQLNRSTVSRQLGALIDEGLVAAGDAELAAGARGQALELTAEGRAAFERATRETRAAIQGRLASWSEDDLETFARLLERYNAASE